jgi:hypothetical protein
MTATRTAPVFEPKAIWRPLALWASMAAFAAAGCVGSVGESQRSGGDSTTPGTPGTDPSGSPGTPATGSPTIPTTGDLGSGGGCKEDAPVVTAARRLTRDQYVNTVRDLLGDPGAAVGGQLPKDDVNDDVFADPRALIVSPDWASNAMDAAEAAAKGAMAKLGSLVPCDPANGDQACVDKFINNFGKRAFRRPLESDEVTALNKVYGVGAQNGGFSHGIEVVIRALLQSPSFLYRLELGQKAGSAGSTIRLNQYEVASRLSYLMWNTMPDQTLMEAADTGKLGSGDEIVAHARRMLNDPRAHQTLGDFHGRWLGIEGLAGMAKDPTKYPQYTDKMMASMKTEFDMYIDEVLFKGGGHLESLFDSKFTFVDAALAPLYGVTAPATGFGRVDLNPAQRSGILTNVGVIAAHTFADESEAIHRGKFVRESLLCVVPPDPPADLMVEPPMPKPGVSIRERLNEHSANPSCKACHVMMDPIGFGFEAYDSVGRFRTTDPSGKPVDDSGVLDMVSDFKTPVAFKGPIELGQKLAGSQQVRTCLVNTVLKFAQGPDASADACVREKLSTAFEASQHDIRELFIAIAKTDGFRFRRAIAGEVLP